MIVGAVEATAVLICPNGGEPRREQGRLQEQRLERIKIPKKRWRLVYEFLKQKTYSDTLLDE